MSYLDEDSARELIIHPIPDFPDIYPDGGVERILRETGRHPFLIQKVCDELCRFLNNHGGRLKASDADLTKVFDVVLAELDLFDEIWRQRTDEERNSLRQLAVSDEPIDRSLVVRQLVREGYLAAHDTKVEFAVPLFRTWIADNQSDG
jgi:uncharacterized protein